MTVPTRTPEQRLEALAAGRTLVQARAAVKKAIHAGDLDVGTVLDAGHRMSGDTVMARLEVYAVVNAERGWGPVKTSRLLEGLGIKPDTHLAQLSQADVDNIVSAVYG